MVKMEAAAVVVVQRVAGAGSAGLRRRSGALRQAGVQAGRQTGRQVGEGWVGAANTCLRAWALGRLRALACCMGCACPHGHVCVDTSAAMATAIVRVNSCDGGSSGAATVASGAAAVAGVIYGQATGGRWACRVPQGRRGAAACWGCGPESRGTANPAAAGAARSRHECYS